MLLSGLALFALCVILCAFFSAAETSFIAANPFALQYREKAGSKRASMVRRIRARTNEFLATILIGNTLVNVAASAIATSLCIRLIPNQNQAVLVATLGTAPDRPDLRRDGPQDLRRAEPGEDGPRLSYPVRGLMIALYPSGQGHFLRDQFSHPGFARAGRLRLPSSSTRRRHASPSAPGPADSRACAAGSVSRRPRHGLPTDQGDHGSPPRDQGHRDRLPAAGRRTRSARPAIPRYPVYRGRLDSVEGIIYGKDSVTYLYRQQRICNKSTSSARRSSCRNPPRSRRSSVKCRDKAVHMALVVDEFGNVDGP